VVVDGKLIGEVELVDSDCQLRLTQPYGGPDVVGGDYGLITPVRVMAPPPAVARAEATLAGVTEAATKYDRQFDAFLANF